MQDNLPALMLCKISSRVTIVPPCLVEGTKWLDTNS